MNSAVNTQLPTMMDGRKNTAVSSQLSKSFIAVMIPLGAVRARSAIPPYWLSCRRAGKGAQFQPQQS